ncbi:CocE/NonD family hydrolase [Salinirubellus salinus]|uniref:CocE/NonD family hydrolase n=1 Tax=Salinirubellus salinus TaxID=1364945 RepID=A0A9E7UAC2_9EURY|nr:CocE/NonD family hydrolase [Salinirubellus salinus]UWM56836.1 CocE/NonD family hydrolase [Salinirubellus salinus]
MSHDEYVHELEIPVDGVTVRATRHEPTERGPRPVVFVYTPYHKDDLSATRADPMVEYLVDAGFEFVVADAVGTGASDGLVDEPFTADEGRHGAAVVEWLAEQAWSNGNVGMIGKSYPGTTALEVAAQTPDGLEAIVPVHAPVRAYDAYFDGGVLAYLRTCGQWAPNFEYLPLQPPVDRSSPDWGERWDDRLSGLRDRTPFLFQYLDHEEKDDYWARKDVPVEQIDVPTLAVGGYRDAFGGGTVSYAERIDAPTEVVLGPWRHAVPEQGDAARIDFLSEVEAWFDDHLTEGGPSRDSAPAVRYWTEQPTSEDPSAGTWRTRAAWPTVEDAAENITLTLDDEGFQADADDPTPVADRWDVDYSVGTDSIGFEIPGATDLDTTRDDVRSLTYETETLEDALELTGTGSASLTVVPDGPAQLVAVRVVDVAPDGTGTLVTHGVTRAGLEAGEIDPAGTTGASATPLTPGEPQAVSVSLRPTSHVFEPGHQLRVAISGAFFPYVSPPDGSAGFVLESTPEMPATLHLPGRRHDGSPEFEDECAFESPQGVYPEPDPPNWETTTDHTGDTATVTLEQSYTKSLAGAEFEYEMAIETAVGRSSLSTETIDRETVTTLRYPTETVRSRVSNSVSRSFATMQYRVERDGETLYSEQKRQSK